MDEIKGELHCLESVSKDTMLFLSFSSDVIEIQVLKSPDYTQLYFDRLLKSLMEQPEHNISKIYQNTKQQ